MAISPPKTEEMPPKVQAAIRGGEDRPRGQEDARPPQTAGNEKKITVRPAINGSELDTSGGWRVSSDFGQRDLNKGNVKSNWHNGFDFARNAKGEAIEGQNVVAPVDGKVIAAGFSESLGGYVLIDAGYGVASVMGHMPKDSLAVKVGDTVSAGQAVGKVGNEGHSTGAHLDQKISINGYWIDPAEVFGKDLDLSDPAVQKQLIKSSKAKAVAAGFPEDKVFISPGIIGKAQSRPGQEHIAQNGTVTKTAGQSYTAVIIPEGKTEEERMIRRTMMDQDYAQMMQQNPILFFFALIMEMFGVSGKGSVLRAFESPGLNKFVSEKTGIENPGQFAKGLSNVYETYDGGAWQGFLKHLEKREGYKNNVYLDSRGFPTVGVGHLVKPEDHLKVGDRISDEQVMAFLQKDAKKAFDEARQQAAELGIDDKEVVIGLASANFQLGSFSKEFYKTWDIMKTQKTGFEQAIARVESAPWNRQTPVRVDDFQSTLKRMIAIRDGKIAAVPLKENTQIAHTNAARLDNNASLAALNIDTSRFDPNLPYGKTATEKAKPFDGIVMHVTGHHTVDKQIQYSQTPDPNRDGAMFGYHFIIGEDGKITQTAPLDKRTNHVKGDIDPTFRNQNTLGIGLVNAHKGATEAQKQAAAQLVTVLRNQYHINPDRVKGHGQVQEDRAHGLGPSHYHGIEGADVIAYINGNKAVPTHDHHEERVASAKKPPTKFSSAADTVKDGAITVAESLTAQHNAVIAKGGTDESKGKPPASLTETHTQTLAKGGTNETQNENHQTEQAERALIAANAATQPAATPTVQTAKI